ncbi:MAG: polysaccharide deacetylase family protein [Burkholderiaceae bacterium]|nr:polysaccharide deacetylase family protein [Burkholderiaceae bacterium]
MLTSVFNLLSPAGARARLSILILHRVLPRLDELDPYAIDAELFDHICGWMKVWFNVLPLDEAVRRLRDGRLPARAAAITFDDGYADNHDVALPILRRHGLTATFFVATGYLSGGRMFNDSVTETLRRAPGPSLDLSRTVLGDLGHHRLDSAEARRGAIESVLRTVRHFPVDERDAFCAELQQRTGVSRLPTDLMMEPGQVRRLHQAGMQIGAHTVHHPMLAGLDDEAARAELVDSRAELEAMVGAPVTLFAYPNGRPDQDYSARTAALVKAAGFEAAVTTAWGAAHRDSDPYQLPRFTPWDHSRCRFGLRMALNLRTRRERVATPDLDVADAALSRS